MKPWDEMSARERDALVAEKVMGWTNVSFDTARYNDWIGWDYTGDWYARIPQYSSDISAAWKVIERLRTNFYRIEVSTTDFGHICVVWEDDIKMLTDAECKTAPEAISLAALRAVGVEI